MAEKKTVSVIIPTYYRNDRLRGAIESIQNQTYDQLELIVVDDSGEAHARSVVESYDVIYISHDENQGPIGAWNTGFARSTGDYVQILDDDDRLFETKIEKQVDLLNTTSEIGLVHCGIQWEFGVVVSPPLSLRGDVLEEVLTLDTSPCVTSTFLMRASILDELFPLPLYPGAADDVLKIEMASRTKFDFIDEALVLRGVDEQNVSESERAIGACFELVDDYSHLYEQVDPAVRRKALAKTYSRQGVLYMSESIWSISAIRSFFYANRYYPGINRQFALQLFLSLFGSGVFRLAHEIAREIKSMAL
jgi:glycosyltransferase involved in cell wall biosynthesis